MLSEVSCPVLDVLGGPMVLFAKLWRLFFRRAQSLINSSTPHSKDSTITTKSTLAPLRTMSHILCDITDRNMAWPDAKLPQTLLYWAPARL